MPIFLLSQCSPILGSLGLRPVSLGPLNRILSSKTAKKAGLALLLGSLLVRCEACTNLSEWISPHIGALNPAFHLCVCSLEFLFSLFLC